MRRVFAGAMRLIAIMVVALTAVLHGGGYVAAQQPPIDELAELRSVVSALQERVDDLEAQVEAIKMYNDVVKLNVLGVNPEFSGGGLSWSSPLSRALEGTWENRDGGLHPICKQTALDKLSAVTENYPTFPFAHYALAECSLRAGNASWRDHAEKARDILRHTTQIAGRNPHHVEVYRRLQRLLTELPR